MKSGGRDFIDQRREPREPLNLPVTLSSLPLETSIAGNLRDISTYGLGLTLRLPMRRGIAVAVQWADRVALGEIVYCIEGEDGSNYRVGFRTDYMIIDRTRLMTEN